MTKAPKWSGAPAGHVQLPGMLGKVSAHRLCSRSIHGRRGVLKRRLFRLVSPTLIKVVMDKRMPRGSLELHDAANYH